MVIAWFVRDFCRPTIWQWRSISIQTNAKKKKRNKMWNNKNIETFSTLAKREATKPRYFRNENCFRLWKRISMDESNKLRVTLACTRETVKISLLCHSRRNNSSNAASNYVKNVSTKKRSRQEILSQNKKKNQRRITERMKKKNDFM